jgi:hypothetical protein
VSEDAASRANLLTRWPLLRRLPLVGVVGLAAWIISTSHGEHFLVRYRLAHDPSVSGLKTEIMREGRLVRSAEWHYGGGAPDEQLQELELPPGDYLVEAQALGRRGPDPKPMPFHVDRDGPHEAVVDFP